jgi:hypothetical protein
MMSSRPGRFDQGPASINPGCDASAFARRANQLGFELWRVWRCRQKYFAGAVGQIRGIESRVSSHRGALANVINAERDAVDAEAR